MEYQTAGSKRVQNVNPFFNFQTQHISKKASRKHFLNIGFIAFISRRS